MVLICQSEMFCLVLARALGQSMKWIAVPGPDVTGQTRMCVRFQIVCVWDCVLECAIKMQTCKRAHVSRQKILIIIIHVSLMALGPKCAGSVGSGTVSGRFSRLNTWQDRFSGHSCTLALTKQAPNKYPAQPGAVNLLGECLCTQQGPKDKQHLVPF